MSGHRYSDYSEHLAGDQQQVHHVAHVSPRNQSFQYQPQQQQQLGQHLMNLPMNTTISITAPSPMGSMRDVNRTSADSQTIQSDLHMIRNQPQQQQQQQQQQQHHQQRRGQQRKVSDNQQLVDMTSQMSLGNSSNNVNFRRQPANGSAAVQQQQQQQYYPEMADESGVDGLDGSMGQTSERASDSRQQLRHSNEHIVVDKETDKSRSQLIDELLRTINDDNFNEIVDFNNKFVAHQQTGADLQQQQPQQLSAMELANQNRPKSAIDGGTQLKPKSPTGSVYSNSSALGQRNAQQVSPQSASYQRPSGAPSTFDNVIRRMSTNLVQNFNKMSGTTLGATSDQQQPTSANSETHVRREKSSTYANSLYVDNQVPARRHSDNTINIPRIQVALSSPQASGSKTNLNQKASASASKLATKWKLTAKTNQRESSDKLSPNLSGALGYMRRHSSGNTTGGNNNDQSGHSSSSHLHISASPFKTRSSSNLGLDFLLSNRSMKRRYSAASMLGHQTQRKAENLIDAGMKSVQNMFGS